MARPKKNEGIRYSVFLKSLPSGSKIYYIKFIDEDAVVFSVRSANTTSRDKAFAEAGRIMTRENLRALALEKRLQRSQEAVERARIEAELKAAQGTEAQRLAKRPIIETLTSFWNPAESPYLQDLADAGRPLSGHYIGENQKNLERYLKTYPPFLSVYMGEISFALVDDFCRQLRRRGASRYTINSIINTLRAPCTWLSARGVMSEISFKGITLPEKKPKERGLLTIDELEKILAIEPQPIWYTEDKKPRIDTQPRYRLAGGQKHAGDPAIGFRERLAVILGAFTGARLGEIRAMRWQDIDLEKGIIRIENNYTDEDGMKDPKARSRRVVVISATLESELIAAKKTMSDMGAAKPENFVLVNPTDLSKPISLITLSRGWDRILRAIGISAEDQKRRNLVFHGLRHLYATRLVDAGLSPGEAAKLTGHRVLATLGRYSDHVQDATLEQARKILDGALHGKK